MNSCKLYLGYAGYCTAKESVAIRGGRKQDITFKALWGLIEHPDEGFILFDTGYSTRFYKATSTYPNKLYAKITKVHINPGSEVKAQLMANNISPESINHIFISHFHADHIGGLRDFPNATLHASDAALRQFIKIPEILGFSKGILKNLVPPDLMQRISIIDNCSKKHLPLLGQVYDLFNDQRLLAVPLPGHAAGQMGLLIATKKHPYFLVADAVWLKKSYQKGILPNRIVRLFFHSWKDYKSTLKKVIKYSSVYPDTKIVPSHCSTTTDMLVTKKIDMDVL